ncbi:MAG: ABC transporter permease [Candidatus Hodarchaeales archaeon]
MLFLDIVKRSLKQLSRSKISLAIMVGLPLFMTFMFWFAFNNSGISLTQTYTIGVLNNDWGVGEELANYMMKLNAKPYIDMGIENETLENGFAADFIKILSSMNYTSEESSSTSIPIFSVKEYTNLTIARKAVEIREIDGLIVFPENYSNATLSAVNQAFYVQNGYYLHNISYGVFFQWDGPPVPTSDNAEIEIIGDKGYSRFKMTETILNQIFNVFNENIKGLNYSGGNIEIDIQMVALEKYSVFDTIIPGLLVFAVLMNASMLASFIVLEYSGSNNTIERVRLSLIKPWEYILGLTIYSFIITFFQVLFLLVTCLTFFQFQPAGDILQGFFVLMMTTIFTTGLGFVLAGIFSSPDTAGQSAGFLMTPLIFMSGGFMEVPEVVLIPSLIPTASGIARDFLLWDILPTTHAIIAIKSILLYDFELVDLLVEILLTVLPSVLLLIFGLWLFTKRRLNTNIS